MSAMKFITVCLFSFFILFGYIMICEAGELTNEEKLVGKEIIPFFYYLRVNIDRNNKKY